MVETVQIRMFSHIGTADRYRSAAYQQTTCVVIIILEKIYFNFIEIVDEII